MTNANTISTMQPALVRLLEVPFTVPTVTEDELDDIHADLDVLTGLPSYFITPLGEEALCG